jgi:hypothetical protein
MLIWFAKKKRRKRKVSLHVMRIDKLRQGTFSWEDWWEPKRPTSENDVWERTKRKKKMHSRPGVPTAENVYIGSFRTARMNMSYTRSNGYYHAWIWQVIVFSCMYDQGDLSFLPAIN